MVRLGLKGVGCGCTSEQRRAFWADIHSRGHGALRGKRTELLSARLKACPFKPVGGLFPFAKGEGEGVQDLMDAGEAVREEIADGADEEDEQIGDSTDT